MLLVKRDEYAWPSPSSENDGAAHLDEVLFQIVPESSVRTGLTFSDQLDVIGSVPPQEKETLESAGYPLISRANPGRSYGLAPYTVDSLASEEAVRLAIAHTLDREALRDAALTPDYAVATNVLADTTPGWADLSDLFATSPRSRSDCSRMRAGSSARTASGSGTASASSSPGRPTTPTTRASSN